MAQNQIDPTDPRLMQAFEQFYRQYYGDEEMGSNIDGKGRTINRDAPYSGLEPGYVGRQMPAQTNNIGNFGQTMNFLQGIQSSNNLPANNNPSTNNVDSKGRLLTDNNYRNQSNYSSPLLTEDEFIQQYMASQPSGQETYGRDYYKNMYSDYKEKYNNDVNAGRPEIYKERQGDVPYINPGGSSYSSKLYLAGKGFGNKQNKGLGIAQGVAGLLSAGIGMTGDFLSGMASQKRGEYIDDWERKNRMQDKNYVAAPQYKDSNYLGGYKDGGIINYQEGGMQEGQPMPQEQMMQQEQQQPQEGQAEQVMAMVSQALQQGAQPQEIVQMLVQQGLPEEQAMQIVQQVMQAMQSQGQPQMQYGGLFGEPINTMPDSNLLGKKPGDPITFKYGGKKYSGKVDRIENGKLFLK